MISVLSPNQTSDDIVLVHTDTVDIKKDTTYTFTTMECTEIKVVLLDKTLQLVTIYRPSDTSVHTFPNELTDYLEATNTSSGKLLM